MFAQPSTNVGVNLWRDVLEIRRVDALSASLVIHRARVGSMRHQIVTVERDPLIEELLAMRFYPSAFFIVSSVRRPMMRLIVLASL